MPRPTRENQRPHMAEDIKTVARQLMREEGTAGLTLRGIARVMDVTAPAIYHYYPSLDDLITALIIDAFISVSQEIEQTIQARTNHPLADRIYAGLLAYRTWAREHPIEFQLIYGNPIPGYHAPPERTDMLARRPFESIGALMVEAWTCGVLQIPPSYSAVPPSIAAHMEGWRAATGIAVPDPLLYLIMVGWSRAHGIIMLESFEHIQPTIGDTAVFYRHEIATFLSSLGLIVSGYDA